MATHLIQNKVKDYDARMRALPFLPQAMGFPFSPFGKGPSPSSVPRGMPFFPPQGFPPKNTMPNSGPNTSYQTQNIYQASNVYQVPKQ